MPRRYLVIIIAGVVAIGIVIAGLSLSSGDYVSDDTASPEPTKTDTKKVIKVEEFCDYQSAPCAQLQPAIKKLRDEYGPRLNLVFRNLPLAEVHQNAVAAAHAAEAARKQNRFWEMHDALYENQQSWEDQSNPQPTFTQLAKDLGLDVARFTRDLNDEQIQFRIDADRDEAVRLGVDSTPTILIEGRKLRAEALSLDGIRRGIQLTIEKDE